MKTSNRGLDMEDPSVHLAAASSAVAGLTEMDGSSATKQPEASK